MRVDPLPSDSLVKQLKVLFGAMLMGQVMFFGVVGFLLYSSPELVKPFSFDGKYSIILPLISAVMLATGAFVPRKMLTRLRAEKDDAKLYAGYRSVCVVRWALHEAAVIVCLAGAYLDFQPSLFIPAGVAFLFFCTLFPTRDRMFSELHLGFRY
ncbi:MAG: hypothetical protein MUC87_16525 [Bacteroidia bacterium]|jgi:hypothetical protein|nr:hypothetical protein [Bacteroidia bacterium]